MREKVAKFMVDDDTFSSIAFNGNKQVTYLRADGFDSTLSKMDFIIFYNSKGENIVKLFWEADANWIEYTSVFLKNSKNISLSAICILLYDSIMWIRHSAYFNEDIKRIFVKFPKDQVKQNIDIIDSCVELLADNITTEIFIEKIKKYENENFKYKSLEALLKEFKWKSNLVDDDMLKNIIIEIENMKKYLSNKKTYSLIWKSAYNIHNEPEKIMQLLE